MNESFYFIRAKLRRGVEIKYLKQEATRIFRQTAYISFAQRKREIPSNNKALANAEIDSRDRRHGKESTNYRSLHSAVTSARARISAIKLRSSIVCCLTYLSKSVRMNMLEYARLQFAADRSAFTHHGAKTERSKLWRGESGRAIDRERARAMQSGLLLKL